MGGCASKEPEAQASQPAPPATDGVQVRLDGWRGPVRGFPTHPYLPLPHAPSFALQKASPPAPASDPQQPTGESSAWAYRGAPRPPNEAERLGLLRALGVLDSEQGPDQFDAITRLLCGVFNVPIALVSLVDAGAALGGCLPPPCEALLLPPRPVPSSPLLTPPVWALRARPPMPPLSPLLRPPRAAMVQVRAGAGQLHADGAGGVVLCLDAAARIALRAGVCCSPPTAVIQLPVPPHCLSTSWGLPSPQPSRF
jgi:hypothetical protein